MRGDRFLSISAALLALPACRTEEINSGPATIVDYGIGSGADRRDVSITLAPPELSQEDWHARLARDLSSTQYILRVDGKQLIYGPGGRDALPFVVFEGTSYVGFLAAGRHRFEIASGPDGSSVFAMDHEILAGSETRLFLFGDRGALQGRVISSSRQPAPGTLHVALINLVRQSPGIEPMSCNDAGACAPLALALGESFSADFPAGTADDTWYRLASGGTIRYRQVATAATPNPTLVDLLPTYPSWLEMYAMSANFVVAPVYMASDGDVRLAY